MLRWWKGVEKPAARGGSAPPMNSSRLFTFDCASSVSCFTSAGPIILYTAAPSDSSLSS